MQDSGAFMFIVFVRDIDATFMGLKALGAPVVTKGGAPSGIPAASPRGRVVVVKDPDGHFVEIYQPNEQPETLAPPTANVTAVRVRLTVNDVDQALRPYRDAFGMKVRSVDEFKNDPTVNDMLGLTRGQYRVGMLEVPSSGLVFELIDFKGVDRKDTRGNIQDPGSTRIQLQVRDVDAAIAAVTRNGGAVVSTGGTAVNLPGRCGARTKVAIVVTLTTCSGVVCRRRHRRPRSRGSLRVARPSDGPAEAGHYDYDCHERSRRESAPRNRERPAQRPSGTASNACSYDGNSRRNDVAPAARRRSFNRRPNLASTM